MRGLAGFLIVASAFAAVDGTVVNQTTGQPQAGAVVTLFKLTQAGPQLVEAAKADARGKFSIAKDTGPGPLLVETGFQGVSYNQMLPPGTPRTGVTVNVFDVTADAAAAPLAQHILILEPAPAGQQLGVTETFLFRNEGKSTYYDAAKGTLRFFAPKDNTGLRVMATSPGSMAVQREPDAAKTPGAYKLAFAIKPGGETRIDVTYAVPYSDPGKFAGKVFYKETPTRLVVPNGVTLEAEGLTSHGHEPQTQAAIYETHAEAFELKIAGTGSLRPAAGAAPEENAEDTGPALRVIPPPGFDDRKLEILALSLAVLALGFTMLYRKGRASAVAAATKSRG
jgi:hypothetical protein